MKTVLAVIATLTLAGAAFAGPLELSVSAGDSVPLGFTNNAIGHQIALGVQGYVPVNAWLALGLESGVMFAGKVGGDDISKSFGTDIDLDQDGVVDHYGFETDQSFQVIHVTPGVKVGSVMGSGSVRWRPYASVAGGVYYVHSTDNVLTEFHKVPYLVTDNFAGLGISRYEDRNLQAPVEGVSQVHAGFNGALGTDVLFGDHWRLSLDLRYHQVLYEKAPDLQFFVPAVRFAYAF